MSDAPLPLAEIDAGLEVCERATPGPWRTINNSSHDSGHRFTVWRERGPGYGMVAHVAPWCPPTNLLDVSQKEADADLIALARTLLPRALRELLERAEEIQKLRRILAFVPGQVYIKAKEDAGYGDKVRASDERLMQDIKAAHKETTNATRCE